MTKLLRLNKRKRQRIPVLNLHNPLTIQIGQLWLKRKRRHNEKLPIKRKLRWKQPQSWRKNNKINKKVSRSRKKRKLAVFLRKQTLNLRQRRLTNHHSLSLNSWILKLQISLSLRYRASLRTSSYRSILISPQKKISMWTQQFSNS